MKKYLPKLCNECVVDNENYTITKIARFDYDAIIHIHGDEWNIRENYVVKYTVYDEGRKIKKYEKRPFAIREDECWETDEEFRKNYSGRYALIKSLGNGNYCVEEKYQDEEKCFIVNSDNVRISEVYDHLWYKGEYVASRRWIDGRLYGGLIDKNGKTILEKRISIHTVDVPLYSLKYDRIKFWMGNSSGLIDFNGRVKFFSEGMRISEIYDLLVVACKDKGPYVVLAEDGTEIMEGEFITTHNNMIVVYDEDYCATIYRYEKKREYALENLIDVEEYFTEEEYLMYEKQVRDVENKFNKILEKHRKNKNVNCDK